MEALVGLGVVGLVVVLYVISTYNSIIGSKNRVKRSWSDVLVHLQKKMQVIPALENQVKDYKEYESKILVDIVKLREASVQLSPKEINPSGLEKVEEMFKKVLSGIKVTMENHPDLKSSDLYKSLMKEIVEQQEDVSAGITIYNRNVEEFNNLISMFPSSVVNSSMNKENPLESFNNDKLPADSEIGFNPKI